MSDLPLTKILDPNDYDELKPELRVVDKYFDPTTQHTHRRWEYAMALRALRTWASTYTSDIRHIADVGGSGSDFFSMVAEAGGLGIVDLIDPKETVSVEGRAGEVADYYAAVISVSTLEHSSEPLGFLNACHHILTPGGLLFLTFDFAVDYTGRDDYHFHWMRERIFHEGLWMQLYSIFKELHGYVLLGGYDWSNQEPQVYNYTFSSLCLRKP